MVERTLIEDRLASLKEQRQILITQLSWREGGIAALEDLLAQESLAPVRPFPVSVPEPVESEVKEG